MSIFTTTPVRPNQALQTGDVNALMTEKFLGLVEGTIQRESIMRGWVSMQTVRNTNAITKKAIGETQISNLVIGDGPSGSPIDVSKNVLTVNTHLLARNTVAQRELFQTDFNVQAELANEQGKRHAKLFDQAILTQAYKAAVATASPYGAVDGFSGGSQEVLALAGDLLDPAKLYAAIANLMAKIEGKDVNPQTDGLVIVTRPDVFYTLLQADQLINMDYTTAAGNTVQNGTVLKAFGVPVLRSNNLLNVNTSTTDVALFGSDYLVDMSNCGLLCFSPKALLVGETIGLTSEVFYDPISKSTFVDTHQMFGAKPDRVEYAGAILKP